MKPILPHRLSSGQHTKKPSAQAAQADALLRLLVAFILIVIFFSILLARFFYLQVTQHNEFSGQASSNRITLIPTPPVRGEIVDINGVPLAKNYPIFSLEVIPSRIEGKMEDVIEALKKYVDITPTDLKRFKKYRESYRKFENIPLKLRLTDEEAARLSVHLREFKGVEVNSRTFREYPYGKLTSHFLGYIGRISDKDKEMLEEEGLTALYRGSTHIGKSGLEKYYEHQLHGVPGYQEVEKDAYGNIVRVLKNVPSKMGQTLRLGMDIRMQQEADRILGDRRGALVAINPQDGTVLAFVSKPSFDPNLFIAGIDSDTWKMLNDDWKKPLINRVTQGLYPPGSTFKPFMGMALLESGKITQNTIVPAPGAWNIPGSRHIFRDSVRSGHGSANLSKAIQVSSDTFFYRLGYEMGIDKASPYLAQFGFGQKTGIDLPSEYAGVLPSREWKAKRFAKSSDPTTKEWRAGEMVSVSIGQGYNAYTPLQMAHATASLANDGVVHQPHLVKEVLDFGARKITRINPNPERQIPFKADNFEYVKRAMEKVLKPGGTAHRIGGGLAYTMGGKTGTAQVVQIKQGGRYNAAALREQHRDHAWFISFAPLEKPEIAIAVILENGGWGAYAAPLAREMTDFYMLHVKPQQFSDGLEADSAKTETTDKHQPITSIFQSAYGLTPTSPASQPEVHHE
ncbi:penicillin-binding protein 2 [Neisseria flavescens]|uniref:Peptidoglycan D,D-transpeptidase MrdA n=1 Tax=Neisseria flavescens NRL30031/H210 TaxID=546264 RepID=C0EL50_NEIFL|nr:penicillin-binding protein 2 [Neisseria flavescens]EEG34270.1 penicillin-binding protein 2 [Neisseria flavescens NRL30031/H210]QCL68929.1 penicillin-binding protein 2 [Neisseria flavescens]SPY10328.1 penicillin-binding protein 2 [Neisseria meningitidis]STZ65073.1 penicillin-binding protein 2 [Neisseria flavescens]